MSIIKNRNLKYKFKLKVWIILIVVFFILIFLISYKYRRNQWERVPLNEVCRELNQIYYDTKAWGELLVTSNEEKLTYSKVDEILERLHLSPYISYEKGKKRYVDRMTWSKIYDRILDYLGDDLLVIKDKVQVIRRVKEKDHYRIETSKGDYIWNYKNCVLKSGYTYVMYIDKNELIGLIEKNVEEIELQQVYIKAPVNGKISIYFKGHIYEYKIDNNIEIQDCVGNVVLKKNKIIKVKVMKDFLEGKLLAYGDTWFQTEGYEKLERELSVPVYSVGGGEVKEISLENIAIGNDLVKFVIAEEKVVAILVEDKEIKSCNIRVLLLNEKKKPYHSEVYVKEQGEFSLEFPNHTKRESTDEVILVKETMTLIPKNSSSTLVFVDKNQQPVSNSYAGKLECIKEEPGIVLVNEVNLEDYTLGVVPSEMPESYPLEALKAQAVCARTYGIHGIRNCSYPAYGAHVDDSTNSQVYNKQKPGENTRKAVLETQGQILEKDGKEYVTFYYSTSFGHTGDMSAWSFQNQPQEGGIWLGEKEEALSLDNPKDFLSYIKKDDPDAYEKDIPYFRWTMDLNFENKVGTLIDSINGKKAVKPDGIEILSLDGGKKYDRISRKALLKNIQVLGRNENGVITDFQITFEQYKVKIYSENLVRSILGNSTSVLTLKDGREMKNISMIPSSFFAIEGGNCHYKLYGGGLGHGIGMSQNAAKGMAERNMDYKTILNTFYKNIQIKEVSEHDL